MVEDTENISENTIRFTGNKNDINISFKGEYIRKGDVLLLSGSRISAVQTAILASNGCVNPLVSIRPRVGIIATGSELIEPDRKPSICKIRNSNGFQLAAQVATIGAIITNFGIVADNKKSLDQVFEKALKENNIVISSGSISEGECDFVRDIIRTGVKILFEKIAVNPGRPMVFGVSDKALCFGMPGNPVSNFIMFELLAKPLLFSMIRYDSKPVSTHMQLEKTIERNHVKRDLWLPVRFNDKGNVTSVKYYGSGHINAFCKTDGLLCIPAWVTEITKGAIVNIRLI